MMAADSTYQGLLHIGTTGNGGGDWVPREGVKTMPKFRYLLGELLIERYNIYDATNERVGVIILPQLSNCRFNYRPKKQKREKTLISELKESSKCLMHLIAEERRVRKRES